MNVTLTYTCAPGLLLTAEDATTTNRQEPFRVYTLLRLAFVITIGYDDAWDDDQELECSV